ncbi:MAG TPA: DUF2169 domain-containing protein [Archangium sp.]|uniref:DUF2169 family type VI secretion system accessory protein n=1 Tax=Archangium sp. TaxID=1872627 RepID=UPI002E2FFAEA|nr:DUF2169 domain-containing protein [Archangium sp.]HEX5749511.1 DUF2169 domain-containing protein [Archangium sp.]
MRLDNLTSLQAGVSIATDKHGYEHVLVVAKGTFDLRDDGTCALAQRQQPLVKADEYHGEPGLSSVRMECDFSLRKPRTDVLLLGHAHAPQGKPVTSMTVGMRVGSLRKALQVFGNRVWERNLLGGLRPCAPEPFLKIPLLYERAFGGIDRSHPDERQHAFENANLLGVGFHSRSHGGISGSALPNLEDPAQLISHPTDKPRPMGLGFISRNWEPRRSYAGTYDQKWLDTRYPFLPLDFDDRYFQGAPEDQTCPYLRGGEQVVLAGVTPEGRLQFSLPEMTVPITLHYRSGAQEVPSIIDTVVLLPDERRCLLVWRSTTRLKGKPTHLFEVQVGTTPGRQRAKQTGKRYIRWSGDAP